MFYHISKIHNLKILEPKISTHGKPYVYAIKNLASGLCFGAEKDDFDFIQNMQEGKAVLWECYPNAFEKCYSGKRCSVYQVDENGFEFGKTGWDAEVVSQNNVKIASEFFVSNLKDALIDEIGKGNLILHRFENTIKYKKIISKHILDRLVRFNYLDKSDEQIKPIIKEHFMKLLEGLRELENGKYL